MHCNSPHSYRKAYKNDNAESFLFEGFFAVKTFVVKAFRYSKLVLQGWAIVFDYMIPLEKNG